MVHQIELVNFKAFKRFSATFHESTFFVGPNNAGKSTLISSLRLCAHLLRFAQRSAASNYRRDRERQVRAFTFGNDQIDLVSENLRHDFNDAETRIELRFRNRCVIRVVWPASDQDDDSGGGFFYLEDENGIEVSRPRTVREKFPTIGIVPLLSPIEQREVVLSPEHVRRHADSKLTSRHFRNQLHILKETILEGGRTEFDAFLEFARPWVPEIAIKALVARMAKGGRELDLFFHEPGTRTEREIAWAGDGLQIWLQLLLHVFRRGDVQTLILDEPDVYLHADLQRRLVRLLESLRIQTVTATHSPEMLAETGPETVVWIDKSRRRAVRAPEGIVLNQLSDSLGSQFNLRLARALRAKLVLFVEGEEMKMLRILAKRLDLEALASETSIAPIPMEGFSKWDHVEPFKWLLDDFLSGTVRVFVLLDRDYRSDATVRAIADRMNSIRVEGHIWRRKEVESYLIVPETIARLVKAERDWVRDELDSASNHLRRDVFARMLDERQRDSVSEKRHRVTVTGEFHDEFEEKWNDIDWRLSVCPPKELLARFNSRLQSSGKKALSFTAIAQNILSKEIPEEAIVVLRRINSLAIAAENETLSAHSVHLSG